MIPEEVLKQLTNLKQVYQSDCYILRRELQQNHPGLLSARLQIRGEKFDEDVQHLLSETQQREEV